MENVRNSSRIPQHWEVENALIDIDFSTNTGKECASISNVDTPANLYRGTQTQRSLTYCSIGNHRLPSKRTGQQYIEIVNPLNMTRCGVNGA